MLQLVDIDRRTGLTRDSFAREYLRLMKPVIFTDLIDDWPAKKKWTVEFFKANYGDLIVPVYSANIANPGKKYMAPDRKIPFGQFLDLLEQGPTDLRMFLFNIFRHAPELCDDFSQPTIMDGFIDNFPFMFFGGEGSTVGLHYDIDLSHVFLNQFHGRKKVVLFAPDQSRSIYQNPFSTASYIDVNNPDYVKYPALESVKGFECILYPGETLFMPSGYWHFIEYTDSGYSMSLRANDSYVRRAKGLINIAKHYVVDRGMNRLMGESWKKMKVGIAKKRAEEEMMV